jgi:hypothetical protein
MPYYLSGTSSGKLDGFRNPARYATEGSVISTNLVIYLDAANTSSYPGFGSVWTDLSGNNRTGTLTNGPTYTSSDGGAIILDGVDDNISLGSFFNYTAFTICMWIRPGATQTTYADILDNNHSSVNWVIQQNVSTTNQYAFHTSGTFNLSANTWVFLTCTYTGTLSTVYLNSVFASQGSGTITYSNPFLRIGAWGGGGRNWNGRVGSFFAYNRVLSLSEIQQNFNVTRARFSI